MIDVGVVAEEFYGGAVVGDHGVVFIVEESEVVESAVFHDGCFPFLGAAAGDALVAGAGFAGARARVPEILLVGADAEIFLAAVEGVVVDVVHDAAGRQGLGKAEDLVVEAAFAALAGGGADGAGGVGAAGGR